NSIGIELETDFRETVAGSLSAVTSIAQRRLTDRLANHLEFVQQRTTAGRIIKHRNRPYGFPVMSAQEVELVFHRPKTVSQTAEDAFLVDYDILQLADGQGPPPSLPKNCKSSEQPRTRPTQGMLFE
ncbi:MAG: hypothetical protein WCE56_18755, partial [Desulfobacterales bacterium]